jgi:Tfp pilus assembly protein FimV
MPPPTQDSPASGLADTELHIPRDFGPPAQPSEAPAEPVGSPAPRTEPLASSSGDLLADFWRAGNLVDLQAVLDRAPRRTYTVQPGDHFIAIVSAATGREDMLVLDLLERMNPQIKDFDFIQPGWVLTLPDLGQHEPAPER